MQQITYNTAEALASISKFYSERDIKIGINAQPMTDGETIWVPPLPNELTKEELATLRAYIDHEAAHIRYGSFKPVRDREGGKLRGRKFSAMLEIVRRYGEAGRIMLNGLDDARIEHCICEEFSGATFDKLHDDFKQKRYEPDSVQALVHAIYMNSRHGWGHHPDCHQWESTLDPWKEKIMKAHKAKGIQGIYEIACEICDGLASDSGEGDSGGDDDSGSEPDDSKDTGDTGDTGDSGGSGDSGDSGDSDDPGDGEGGEPDDSASADGDGDCDGGEAADGSDSGGDSGDGGGDDASSSDDATDATDGGGDGSEQSSDPGGSNSAGDAGGADNGKSSIDRINESGEEATDAKYSMVDSLKESDDGTRDRMTMDDYSMKGGTTRWGASSGDCFVEYGGQENIRSQHRAGYMRGSILGRLVKSRISSASMSGKSAPRGSGQNIHRGSLARFASGMTNRILQRDIIDIEVATDVVILADVSASVSHEDYLAMANAMGCLDRGLCMAGASVGIVTFGSHIRMIKPLSPSPLRKIAFPDQEGATDTGHAMIAAHGMLCQGNNPRKICVVLTDGVPGGYIVEEGNRSRKVGSPCIQAMRMYHRSGFELLPLPFSAGMSNASLGHVARRMRTNAADYGPRWAPIWPFVQYMADHGVFVGDVEKSPRDIAKMILEFKGDLRNYV
jgi:hypothetical protein